MGLTHSDQRQPGSKRARITVTSPSLTTSIFPFSIERVSSGLSKLFRSIFAIVTLLLNDRPSAALCRVPRHTADLGIGVLLRSTSSLLSDGYFAGLFSRRGPHSKVAPRQLKVPAATSAGERSA